MFSAQNLNYSSTDPERIWIKAKFERQFKAASSKTRELIHDGTKLTNFRPELENGPGTSSRFSGRGHMGMRYQSFKENRRWIHWKLVFQFSDRTKFFSYTEIDAILASNLNMTHIEWFHWGLSSVLSNLDNIFSFSCTRMNLMHRISYATNNFDSL